MTQSSYFWYGNTIGDAVNAPYTVNIIHEIIRKIFNSRPATEGVIKGYGNELEVTNPSGLNISINTGAALVYDRLYENDAAISSAVVAPGAGSNYYTYVLRLDMTAQTIRLVRVGPDVGTYPSPTQDATPGTWEIELAQVRVTSSSVVTLTDRRAYSRLNGMQIPLVLAHESQSDNWFKGGETAHNLDNLDFQYGTYQILSSLYPANDDLGAHIPVPAYDADFINERNSDFPIVKFATPITNNPNIVVEMDQEIPLNQNLSWYDFTGGTHSSHTLGYLYIGGFKYS